MTEALFDADDYPAADDDRVEPVGLPVREHHMLRLLADRYIPARGGQDCRRCAMTSWAESRRDAALRRDFERQQAERVDCPGCGALAGESCVASDGVPLGKSPAHHQRIKASDVLDEQGGVMS